jgi:2-methylcitrate dehydratase PrpD
MAEADAPRVIAEAISAAGSVAPIMAVAEFTEVVNHVKEAIPHATANGLACLHLAQAGFVAPLDILDDARVFSGERLLDGWGKPWMIESCYFKPYSCCRWIHASIGLLKITADRKPFFQDITKIRVETFGKAMNLNNQKAPKSLQACDGRWTTCAQATSRRYLQN